MAVFKAVHYPLHNRDLHKNVNVQIDTTWLETMNSIDNEIENLLHK